MKFPSTRKVAIELQDINENVEGETDVRLQVYRDGKWCVRVGDSSYDLDHTGFWGAASLPGYPNALSTKDADTIANELISQCKEMYHA